MSDMIFHFEDCPSCYTNRLTADDEDEWFTEPCGVPHLLVWARRGCVPFWPAKALQQDKKKMEVQYFGSHDINWVPVNQTYLLSEEYPKTLNERSEEKRAPRLSRDLEVAMEEMRVHVQKIRHKFKDFEYAPQRTPCYSVKDSPGCKNVNDDIGYSTQGYGYQASMTCVQLPLRLKLFEEKRPATTCDDAPEVPGLLSRLKSRTQACLEQSLCHGKSLEELLIGVIIGVSAGIRPCDPPAKGDVPTEHKQGPYPKAAAGCAKDVFDSFPPVDIEIEDLSFSEESSDSEDACQEEDKNDSLKVKVKGQGMIAYAETDSNGNAVGAASVDYSVTPVDYSKHATHESESVDGKSLVNDEKETRVIIEDNDSTADADTEDMKDDDDDDTEAIYSSDEDQV